MKEKETQHCSGRTNVAAPDGVKELYQQSQPGEQRRME
ncbi:MAG: hypothetical protein ACD_12C00480G0001 [uncultured bacterium]|nr:MAG: hypothetical protein ACD_12C00480G0001 [uncultured bacterium]